MFQSYKNFLNHTFRSAQRRYLVLTLKDFLPDESAMVLDIGTANGEFALMIKQTIPNLTFIGVDIMERGTPHIPTVICDGANMPFADHDFDYALLINMLHHTDDPKALLKEALRVSRKGVIIKDHYANNWFDYVTLLAMEYANPNSRALLQRPLRFYSKKAWDALFAELGLTCDAYTDRFTSYSRFWDMLFGRNMHFIGRYHLPK